MGEGGGYLFLHCVGCVFFFSKSLGMQIFFNTHSYHLIHYKFSSSVGKISSYQICNVSNNTQHCIFSSIFTHRPSNNPTKTYRYYSLPFCQTHANEDEHKAALEEEMTINPDATGAANNEDFGMGGRSGGPSSNAAAQILADCVGSERHKQRLGESIAGD